MSSIAAYENLGELGKGSYGAVTKNRHVLTGDIVAIKCFVTDAKDYATVKRSVLIEVGALRELRHDNIVRLFHVFVEVVKGAIFYMVFEFVDKTLLDVIREAPKKCLGCGTRTKTIMFQIIRALSFIHSRNFVHRDIKPENILVTKDDIVRVADFGFATKITHPGQRYSTYIATRWYRAPELLIGEFLYGKGVDVWAAGAVAVEMILGHPLANGADDCEQMAKTITLVGQVPRYMLDRARSLYENFPNVPEDLPLFAGLQHLLRHQPTAYVNFIKLSLNPDPLLRSTANALLTNPLFTAEDKTFVPALVTQIKQSNLEHGHSAALSYQNFLRKRDVYHRASRDFALESTTSGYLNVLTRYRQLGLDDQTLRYMADMIIRERKIPPDFSSTENDLYTVAPHAARSDFSTGDNALTRPVVPSSSHRFVANSHVFIQSTAPMVSQSYSKPVSIQPSFVARANASNLPPRSVGSTASSNAKAFEAEMKPTLPSSHAIPRGIPSTQQQKLRLKPSLNTRHSALSLTSRCTGVDTAKLQETRMSSGSWYKSLVSWKNWKGRTKNQRDDDEDPPADGARKWRFDENRHYGDQSGPDDQDMSFDSDVGADEVFSHTPINGGGDVSNKSADKESECNFHFKNGKWNFAPDDQSLQNFCYSNLVPSKTSWTPSISPRGMERERYVLLSDSAVMITDPTVKDTKS